MKFIAGLRVWVNGAMGKTPQVFPKIRGSANRRVDLHLPLIASILGRRHGARSGRTVAKGRGRWGPTTLLGRPKVGGRFRLRDLEGRLNSAFLGLFSTSCGPSFSGHGYP